MELNGFSKFNALQDSPLPQVHNKSGSSGSSPSDSIKNNFDGATTSDSFRLLLCSVAVVASLVFWILLF
uniref:Transmembrane protein n=1 Tax=Manihot esculenta TaxID=3983 RepID=A0A2C9VZ28_MANES